MVAWKLAARKKKGFLKIFAPLELSSQNGYAAPKTLVESVLSLYVIPYESVWSDDFWQSGMGCHLLGIGGCATILSPLVCVWRVFPSGSLRIWYSFQWVVSPGLWLGHLHQYIATIISMGIDLHIYAPKRLCRLAQSSKLLWLHGCLDSM